MTRFLIVSVVAMLLLSCHVDKSKNRDGETKDSTMDSMRKSRANVENKLPVSYPFRLQIHEGSNWRLQIDTITEKQFDQTKKVVHQAKNLNGDSLIAVISRKHNDVIFLTDSCFILKGLEKDLEVCRKQTGNDREWTDYDGVDFDHGFLIFVESAYENSSYLSFNPITRQCIRTDNEPHFIDNNLIYAAGNYYAEGQFQIKNLKEDKYFGFETFNWELTGFYRRANSILMEFTSRENKKYLMATFN